MALVRPFHRFRGVSAITLPEFIAILGELIPQVVPAQSKYRVTEIPTERTIRFYTARGLVDKPTERRGTQALYSYRHILQILAVKYLQSHHLTLVKIRSLVENAGNRELEQMIPEVLPAGSAHRIFAREDRRVALRGAPSGLEQAREEPPAEEPPPADPEGAPGYSDVWHRLEVAPGIELHVHAVALSGEQRERLRGTVLRELGVLRGWF